MKKLFLALALALTMPAAGPVLAHPEPDDGYRQYANPEQIKTVALSALDTLVLRKVLDESWKDLQPASSVTRTRNAFTEWVVTFENPKVKDPAKRKLYVFVNMYGDYLAANQTGE